MSVYRYVANKDGILDAIVDFVFAEIELPVAAGGWGADMPPINGPDSVADLDDSMMQQFPVDDYPHLVEFTIAHVMQPGYDFGSESSTRSASSSPEYRPRSLCMIQECPCDQIRDVVVRRGTLFTALSVDSE